MLKQRTSDYNTFLWRETIYKNLQLKMNNNIIYKRSIFITNKLFFSFMRRRALSNLLFSDRYPHYKKLIGSFQATRLIKVTQNFKNNSYIFYFE